MRRHALLLAVLAIAAACSRKDKDGDVVRLDDNHYLGAAVTVENLTVWPVFAEKTQDLGEFLTLPEAQTRKLAVVREAGGDANGDGATVNRLVIENTGDLPILVCAGTIVQGGKQDRLIGQDFVIQAKTTTPVDAFCVEQGRWVMAVEGAGFIGDQGIAPKQVREVGQYADPEIAQTGVWEKVAEVNASRKATPSTGTLLASMIDAPPESKAYERKVSEAVRGHFEPLRGKAVGFAYAINGKPVSVRTFAHPRICTGQLEEFLSAMCMEAELLKDAKDKKAAKAEQIVALIRAIEQADEELKETEAGNTNGYRTAELGYGASCYVGLAGKRRIALTRDWTAR